MFCKLKNKNKLQYWDRNWIKTEVNGPNCISNGWHDSTLGKKVIIQIILSIVPWLYTFHLKTKEMERNLELYTFTVDSSIDGMIQKLFYLAGLDKYIDFGGDPGFLGHWAIGLTLEVSI